jgi:hypothetical protein
MATYTIDQARDVIHGTLQHIAMRKPAYTYAYSQYAMFNSFWKSNKKVQGGKYIEGYVNLLDEGNAKMAGFWDEDTHNITNISKLYTVNWTHATTNTSWNMIEVDINNGPEQIFNVVDMKRDNMVRELVDVIYQKIWATPSSSSDTLSFQGIPAWLSLGTQSSTGGWTGYQARYNDGSTPGTAYDVGGINSSATVNPRWASYYADHKDNIDDSLLVLLDRATRKLNFTGPQTPAGNLDLGGAQGVYSPRFSLYSNDYVIGQLNALYAKSDDQMGFRIGSHFGVPTFKGVSFEYVDLLDSDNASLYGANPIYGINHNMLYPMVLTGWDWTVSKPVTRAAGNQHLVVSVYCDIVGQIFAEGGRRHAGFLISDHPSN